jgi:methylated-DNA-[protein]-cysteine S-methyltransferase
MPQRSLHSPIGDLTVSEEGGAIVALDWGWGRDQGESALLGEAVRQLEAYFDGALNDFDLPTEPAGSAFQVRVWRAMQAIPAGATRTYGELARELGSAARAVGTACGANPVPVIIPCHRILAASGLGGYSGDGGIETKCALLRLEGVLL